jgi:hypothetical protein
MRPYTVDGLLMRRHTLEVAVVDPHLVASVDEGSLSVRLGQLTAYWPVSFFRGCSDLRLPLHTANGRWVGQTAFSIFAPSLDGTGWFAADRVVGKTAYCATFIEDEKNQIQDTTIFRPDGGLSINRRLGQVVWSDWETDQVLVLIDEGVPISEQRWLQPIEQFRVKSHGLEHHIVGRTRAVCPWLYSV